MKPLFVGDIWFDPELPTKPKLIPSATGPLRIYEDYDEKQKGNAAGVDTAEGKRLDDSAVVLLANDPARTLAVYQSDSIEPQQYGVRVYLLGLLYDAFLVVEANTVGQTVLGVLEHGLLQVPLSGPIRNKLAEMEREQNGKYVEHMKRYTKLYTEQRLDVKTLEEKTSLGMRSLTGTRERIISNLAELYNMGMWQARDIPLLQQMQGLVLEPKQVFSKKGTLSQKKQYVQTFRLPGSRMAKDDLILAASFANHGLFYAPKAPESLGTEPEVVSW